MGSSSWRMWSVAILGIVVSSMPATAQQQTADRKHETARVATEATCLAFDGKEACVETPAAAPASVSERLVLPPTAGPLLAATRTETRTVDAPAAPVFQRSRGPGYALAIAGGALFVAGLIAGDDEGAVMMLVGAGVGAYGLYLMLR